MSNIVQFTPKTSNAKKQPAIASDAQLADCLKALQAIIIRDLTHASQTLEASTAHLHSLQNMQIDPALRKTIIYGSLEIGRLIDDAHAQLAALLLKSGA